MAYQVKSIVCSYRISEFESQHPHVSSWLSVTLVLETPTTSSGPHGHQTHKQCTNMPTGKNTHTYTYVCARAHIYTHRHTHNVYSKH